MAGIAVSGIGSGLDLNGLVTQLITAQAEPATRTINSREAGFQARISGYGSLKSALADFQTTLEGLRTPASFTARSAISNDGSALSAAADGTAVSGVYSAEVNQLAQSQKLASKAFSESTETIGEGTLTFRFGTYDSDANTFAADAERNVASLTIDSSNSSLAGIRDAVNEANAGVTASIVDDGSGQRLVFGSVNTGASSSIEITVSGDSGGTDTDDSGLSQLAFNPTSVLGTGKNLSETAAAQDANITIDGLTITRPSNTIKGVLEGVTLNLEGVSEAAFSLTVRRDEDVATTAVESFVSGFNALNSTFKSLSGYNASTGVGGILLGDAVLRGVESSVRRAATNIVAGLSGQSIRTLADIGITTQAGGSLSLDSAKLQTALKTSPDALAGLFGVAGLTQDSAIEFVSGASNTQEGDYNIVLSQLATRGDYVGATATSLTVDGTNDTLSLNIDGVQTATLSLSQKTYANETALAAEIQARINTDSALSAAGKRVTVTFDTDHYVIQSNSYGSESNISISSAAAGSTSTLGIATTTGTATAGLDVAGTIGGVAASGSGQQLTGNGEAADLVVNITGGTIGQRGTVTFARGVAEQLHGVVASFLNPNAALETSIEGLSGQVDNLNTERDNLTRRLEANEARLRSQFAALDVLISQLQTTSTFLTQQLASIATINTRRN